MMNKKILSLVLACTIMSIPTVAFAEGTDGTQANNVPAVTTTTDTTDPADGTTQTPDTAPTAGDSAWESFYTNVYMPKMTTIVQLRVDTKNAVAADEAISTQIKNAIEAKFTNDTQALEGQVKAGRDKIKNDAASAKALNQQRIDLRKQFSAEIKNQSTSDMAAAQAQYQSLLTQISTLKTQIQADKTAIQPLVAQLETARQARKTALAGVQTLVDQAKTMHEQILQEEQAKNQLWTTYKQDIQAKDYTSAGTVLQSIIDAKTKIISDINARGQVLNQIITAINGQTTTNNQTTTTSPTTDNSGTTTDIQQ